MVELGTIAVLIVLGGGVSGAVIWYYFQEKRRHIRKVLDMVNRRQGAE